MDLKPEAFGIPEVTELPLHAEHARRLAAVLDSPAEPQEGDTLPALWHWAFGTPTERTRALGPDGHPLIPPGGPSQGLPRRMWAGGRVRILGGLTLLRFSEGAKSIDDEQFDQLLPEPEPKQEQ